MGEPQGVKCLLFGDVMAEFKSWRSYWEFEMGVRTKTRYIYDSDVKTFFDAVLWRLGSGMTVDLSLFFPMGDLI